MATKIKKKKTTKSSDEKKEEERSKTGVTDATQQKLLILRDQIDRHSRIIENTPDEDQEAKDHLNRTRSELKKEAKKLSKTREPLNPALTEDFYRLQLNILQSEYKYQVETCEKKKNFETKGWSKIIKAAKKAEAVIGGKFEPLSRKESHNFDSGQVDKIAEGYFQFCKNLKDVKKQIHAIAVSEDGDCFFECLSKAMNGDGIFQSYELRLRGAVFYANNYQKIHEIGSNIGWARATGETLYAYTRKSSSLFNSNLNYLIFFECFFTHA